MPLGCLIVLSCKTKYVWPVTLLTITYLFFFPLQEVIDLTKDLLTSQPTDSASTTNGSDTIPVKHSWKVGDSCMAVWSQDGQ